MDVWRVPAAGGPAERITTHNSRVAYPVLLDAHTLLYTATADDGTGPWLYSMELDERVPRRVSNGGRTLHLDRRERRCRRDSRGVSSPPSRTRASTLERSDRRRRGRRSSGEPAWLCQPRAPPRRGSFLILQFCIWRRAAGRTGCGVSPDARRERAVEADAGAVVGAAAVSPDGKTAAFPCAGRVGRRSIARARTEPERGFSRSHWMCAARRPGRPMANGSPSPRKARRRSRFQDPRDGGAPVQLVDSVSTNPVWSPDGAFILYSGTPRARNVPVKAVTPDGRPYADSRALGRSRRRQLSLSAGRQTAGREARRISPAGLLAVRACDGQRRHLTNLRPGESLHRFDVSPDGKRILFERVRENSDIVLIELPRS